MVRHRLVLALALASTLGIVACGADDPSPAGTHPDGSNHLELEAAEAGATLPSPASLPSDEPSVEPIEAAAPAPTRGGRKLDGATADALLEQQEAAALAVQGAPDMEQTYQHSTGFFFRYPSTWAVQEGAEGLALVPPDPVSIEGQPAEAIFVIGESAEGITRPDDPQVGAYLDQILGSGPLKSTGKPEARTYPQHEGAVYSWEGPSPEGLGDFAARAWITILEGYAIGAFALGPKDRLEARAQVIEDVFATFGFERPESDPRLFGYWRYTDTYVSGTFTFASDTHLRLYPDGTCLQSSESLGGLQSTDGAGNYTGDVSASSGSGATRGRWHTADKRITLTWPDGTEEWEYLISGNDMMWRSGGSKRMWDRIE